MDKWGNLLGGLDLSGGAGLEFGPMTCPIVTKDRGKIYYIDHETTEGLRNKYKTHANVDVSQLVDIDFVSDGRRLFDVVDGMKFDYVVASHVFEHLPNPVGWLNECAEILNPNGAIRIAVPDKRYTFDARRELTKLSEWVYAYIEDRKMPSPGTVYEAAADTNGYDFSKIVEPPHVPIFVHEPDVRAALQIAKAAQNQYTDCHCTVCTVDSFEKLISESYSLGLHKFKIEEIFAPEPGWNEFQARLRIA